MGPEKGNIQKTGYVTFAHTQKKKKKKNSTHLPHCFSLGEKIQKLSKPLKPPITILLIDIHFFFFFFFSETTKEKPIKLLLETDNIKNENQSLNLTDSSYDSTVVCRAAYAP